MRTLMFNPAYFLRQDGNRVILFSDYASIKEGADENWLSFIHPFHAMMFAFFNGKKSECAEIECCSKFFNLSMSQTELILKRFINNKNSFGIRINNNVTIYFPRNVILDIEFDSEKERSVDYTPSDFSYQGSPDFKTIRLQHPLSINMELTMNCYANCIYCYAKRILRDKTMLSKDELCAFIREARTTGVYNVDINGGDVLLHPHIKEILKELVVNGYKPLVSTKTVLSKEIIDYIISLKNVRLQISLDSVKPQTLHALIGVPLDYLSKLSLALDYLSNAKFPIDINVVLTKYNSSNKEIRNLLNYLSHYKSVQEVRFNPCGCSLYKHDFSSLILPLEEIENTIKYIEGLRRDYKNFKIRISGYEKCMDYNATNKKLLFKNRAICTGGTRSVVLLPNGDLTICEELYDHPAFILGNIRKNTLDEIWNSPKAKSLYVKETFSNSKSVCKECADFVKCRNREGVCWKLILMAYGMGHWDYPDPRCPKSPPPLRKFYYE